MPVNARHFFSRKLRWRNPTTSDPANFRPQGSIGDLYGSSFSIFIQGRWSASMASNWPCMTVNCCWNATDHGRPNKWEPWTAPSRSCRSLSNSSFLSAAKPRATKFLRLRANVLAGRFCASSLLARVGEQSSARWGERRPWRAQLGGLGTASSALAKPTLARRLVMPSRGQRCRASGRRPHHPKDLLQNPDAGTEGVTIAVDDQG